MPDNDPENFKEPGWPEPADHPRPGADLSLVAKQLEAQTALLRQLGALLEARTKEQARVIEEIMRRLAGLESREKHGISPE